MRLVFELIASLNQEMYISSGLVIILGGYDLRNEGYHQITGFLLREVEGS